MDRLQSMEVFVKVARQGSFSAAAALCGMSKSTVSKHVAALEERLGVRLLNRTTRRLSLTQSGEYYLQRCSAILDAVGDVEQSLSAFNATPRGRLKVAAPMSFGLLHLSPLLPRFMRAYPDLELELVLDDRRADLVEDGFDVALRIGRLKDSGLIARQLARVPLVCAASPSYLAAFPAPRVPADLARHECLRYSLSSTPNEWLFSKDGNLERVRVNGSFSANNGEVLRDAAIAGHGICMQPLFIIARDLEEGRLVPLLEDYGTAEVTINAVFAHQRLVSPKLRSFIDFLVDHMGRRSDWLWPRQPERGGDGG